MLLRASARLRVKCTTQIRGYRGILITDDLLDDLLFEIHPSAGTGTYVNQNRRIANTPNESIAAIRVRIRARYDIYRYFQ